MSVNMSANKEVNATFVQDTADNDEDGLSNYAELVTHSTDPNDSDSDDDTLMIRMRYRSGWIRMPPIPH